MKQTLVILSGALLIVVPAALLLWHADPDCAIDCVQRIWLARLLTAWAIVAVASVGFLGLGRSVPLGKRVLACICSMLACVAIAYLRSGGAG